MGINLFRIEDMLDYSYPPTPAFEVDLPPLGTPIVPIQAIKRTYQPSLIVSLLHSN